MIEFDSQAADSELYMHLEVHRLVSQRVPVIAICSEPFTEQRDREQLQHLTGGTETPVRLLPSSVRG